MILLFHPAPPQLEWRCVSDDGIREYAVDVEGDWPATVLGSFAVGERVQAVGYYLHNGGDEITEPADMFTSETVGRLRKIVHLSPQRNHMTLQAATFAMQRWPDAAHVLFCDTAFFTRLPPAVRTYALPYELTQAGLHRYGGSGLCHEEMWRQAQASTGGRARRVVSGYLGDRSNLAAIRDGVPVETTVGLTHLEGLMSSQGCGEIDPTIVFQLAAAGLPYPAINQLLSTQSGFTALAGRPCGLADVLGGAGDPGLATARRTFTYQVIRYLGAMLAVLGGVDVLIFAGERPAEIMPLVWDVCDAVSFLGIRCRPEEGRTGFPRLVSVEDSTVAVLVGSYSPWEAMAGHIRRMMEDHKERMR